MNPQLLKLVFVKGPKDGDSLEYKPGSIIRVGRIVRGNDIAIKDAGISTKHLRIVSESENWIIHDLGSSNGTILNSETLDPDTPVNLRHGDIIKLGEYTSIVVNFVDDVQENVNLQEHKLPPRPRRNNRRLAVADPDPVESIQAKQPRRGRPPKQDIARSKENDEEHELPKKTRASRSRALEEVSEEEKGFEGKIEKKVNSRVKKAPKNVSTENSCVDGKKVEITSVVQEDEDDKEEKEEKKGNSRVRRGRNIGSAKSSCLNSIKLEIESTPKVVETSDAPERKGVSRKTTGNKQIENVGKPGFRSENTESEEVAVGALEEKDEKRITSIATRSKKKEIGGDSFLELGMVLNQARMSRAKKKKMEPKLLESVEATNDDKENDAEEKAPSCPVEEDHETKKGCSEGVDERCDKEDDAAEGSGSKSVDQVERELRKSASQEDDQNCSVREDGDNLQNLGLPEECGEATDEAREYRSSEAEASNRNLNMVEVDLGKMTLGGWFNFMECHLPKQIIDETERMIEPMRMKASRVRKHIAEQKKAKGGEVV